MVPSPFPLRLTNPRLSRTIWFLKVSGSFPATAPVSWVRKVSANVNGTTPAADTIIAGSTYELGGWAVKAFEIDLTGVDYNGPVFVAIDTLPGTFALFSSVEFIA